MIRRGHIYFAALDEGIGSEQTGSRPVLIIQNDIGNLYSRTVIVIPITSAEKNDMLTHVKLGSNYGLVADSTALAEHILTIDRERIGEYLGTVDDMKMLDVDQALRVSLALDYDNE